MSYKITNLLDNANVEILDQKGPFTVYEYYRDLSISPSNAVSAYYSSEMNVRRRVVLCELSKGSVVMQAGAMQWMLGDCQATSGVKGVKDLAKKVIGGSVTGESAIKPEYVGTGMVALEPTYKHILLEFVNDWKGGIVVDDGLFLCCDAAVQLQVVARQNVSSAVAGGHGLFNLSMSGLGVVALEAPCPRDELITVDLENDVLKIDGNLAIAWSRSLNFTVERAGKTLIGSAASGEGLVNVYRGTGRVLMMPTKHM